MGITGIIIGNRRVSISGKYLVAGMGFLGEECCLKTFLFYSYHTPLTSKLVLSLIMKNEMEKMKLVASPYERENSSILKSFVISS